MAMVAFYSVQTIRGLEFFFPYSLLVTSMGIIPALMVVFGGTRVYVDHSPRFTTLVSLEMICRLIVSASWWLFRGLPVETGQSLAHPRSPVSLCFTNFSVACA
eukprot:CAMPEP_0185784890 /NCGR_PEP_ID=MMETSP1174-20130828/126105_1 /TAXON_ID=35687 /ORGANISM="Dictyocha speculum, Strain CCMP1381" /LENGTH=102 /DNA_ID=CAMNT_0028476699 /DNA_START=12 /DNA_END=316 /DNA_ORIENTATION=-